MVIFLTGKERMPVIVIRHANDEGKCFKKHDCPVNIKDGGKDARKVGISLIKKYGLPDEIIVSPFRRTKETLELMVGDEIHKIKITQDPNISRYFSGREKDHPDVHSSTLKHNIPINESFRSFERRVRKFSQKLEEINMKDRCIWVITHALVYKRIGRYYERQTPSRIDFLEYFVLHEEYCDKCKITHL